MTWLDRLPIRRKLILIIVAICSTVLLLACIALGTYELFEFRRALARDTTVMADIVGGNSRAALSFDDDKAAQRVLQALQSEPHVVAAVLYGPGGHRFAAYIRSGATAFIPERPGDDGARFESGFLVVFRPMQLNGKRIGTIYLQSDLKGIRDRLTFFGLFAGLVLVTASLVGLALSAKLQRPISDPILALAHVAQRIAEQKDYSVRASQRAQGELGILTDAFNQMIGGIAERDAALRQANDSLRNEIGERQRTAAALAVSEKHYRLIFEHSPVPMWIYDVETLRFLSVNQAAVAHYGFSESEFLAMTIRDIRPPEDIPALEADVAAALISGSGVNEWRHRKKNGTTIDVLVNAHNIDFGAHRARMVVIQDITDRKSAEAKAQAQLSRLDQLNRITRAIGERQDMDSIFQAVVRSLEEQMPVDFTCICLYDSATEALTVSKVGVRSEALAAQLTMPAQSSIPIDRNGLSRCVRGHLVYEPDVSHVPMPFAQRLTRGGLRSLVMAPLLVESKVFGVLVTARSEPDRFTSADCEFLRQLSEHVALAAHQAQLYVALQGAYDDLRQTQQLVMQQERLRALGQMASGIAHDINNAISPISLYIESLLEREKGLSVQAHDWLVTIQHAIDDVTHTVARLRDFYRQREPELTLAEVDGNQIMEQVAEVTRARWYDMPQQRGVVIELRRELEPNLPKVLSVESEIREALINLVFNAVDAMPNGGVLTLRTRRVTRRNAQGTELDPVVAFEVSDTGIGMDEETKRRCLEPFFTTKGERGTGLGLAMVYGIARRNNAEIEIDTKVGRGTTMRLLFNIAQGPARPSADSSPALKPAARLRILVVDDDPLLLKSLRETLEGDGHLVVTTNGGQAGINAFQAAHVSPDPFMVVITDLGMPYVDGRKVAATVKGISPTTPVILLTGWGQRLVAEGDIPPHVDRVLSKPPKLRELRSALATIGSN